MVSSMVSRQRDLWTSIFLGLGAAEDLACQESTHLEMGTGVASAFPTPELPARTKTTYAVRLGIK